MVRFSIPGPEVSVFMFGGVGPILNPRLADGEMKSSGGYVMPPSSPAGCAPTAPELLNKFRLLGNPFVRSILLATRLGRVGKFRSAQTLSTSYPCCPVKNGGKVPFAANGWLRMAQTAVDTFLPAKSFAHLTRDATHHSLATARIRYTVASPCRVDEQCLS